MLDRRAFLGMLGLLAAPLGAEAQPTRVPRIGVLSPTTSGSPIVRAFEQGLADEGYGPDKTIRLEHRHTAGRGDRLSDFAAELTDAKVDIIAVWSSAGALAAQQATRTISVVFVSVTSPERIGLVQSVVPPGGNITGVAFTATEAMYSKALEILKEAVPTARRVAILLGQANPVTMQAINSAVRDLKITIEPHVATEPEHLDAALAAIGRSRVDALYVPPSGLAYQHRKKIVSFSRAVACLRFIRFASLSKTTVFFALARVSWGWRARAPASSSAS